MSNRDFLKENYIVKAKPLSNIPAKIKIIAGLFILIFWFLPGFLLLINIKDKNIFTTDTITLFFLFFVFTLLFKSFLNLFRLRIVFDFKSKRVVFAYNFREKVISSKEIRNWRLHYILMRGKYYSYQRYFLCTLLNGKTFQYPLAISPVLNPQEKQDSSTLEKDYAFLFKKAFDMEPEKTTKSKSFIDEMKASWDAIWF